MDTFSIHEDQGYCDIFFFYFYEWDATHEIKPFQLTKID